MKYVVSMLICASLVFGGWIVDGYADEAESYEYEVVTDAMRTLNKLLGQVKKATKEEAYFTAAETLMEIAKTFKSLDTITPRKGSKEEWDTVHGDLINAALKGIGACGKKDLQALQAALDDIIVFMKQGHMLFR